jgi:fumarate hydratase subunit beta
MLISVTRTAESRSRGDHTDSQRPRVPAVSWDVHGASDFDRLTAGDSVELTGRVISLRDTSAARLAKSIEQKERLPVSLSGQVMYAVGPSPAQPGHIIGSAGPTTTARMARFLPALFSAGVAAVIGKGELHGEDMAAFLRHGAIYLAAVGGLGALLAKQIRAASVIAYADLGAEALHALDVEAFPAVVIIDREGRNFHEEARKQWRKVEL